MTVVNTSKIPAITEAKTTSSAKELVERACFHLALKCPAVAVAFSPDGRLIVSGSYDKTVRVWDAATGAERRVLQGHSDYVNAVAFSLDGRLIVSGSADNTARVWDAATGAERRVLRGQNAALRFLSFSSCGKHLVTDRGTLRLPFFDC
jgi:WD40 repeat protein